MNKKLNIILGIIVGILLCVFLGITIYKKIDENNRKYSYSRMLKIYNSVKYDENVNIYFFYGKGCPHCENEMKFFNNLGDDYKAISNLYKFETWHNENTKQLKKLVVDKLIEDGFIELTEENPIESYYDPVPFLVIGNRVLVGYAESLDDEIKQIILNQRNNNSYDVLKELDLK